MQGRTRESLTVQHTDSSPHAVYLRSLPWGCSRLLLLGSICLVVAESVHACRRCGNSMVESASGGGKAPLALPSSSECGGEAADVAPLPLLYHTILCYGYSATGKGPIHQCS